MLVCRLCLKLSPEESSKDISTLDGEQFKLILPEINFHSTKSPMICDLCLRSLDAAYTFKTSCMQTETLINSYKEIHGNVNLIEIYESNTVLDSFDEECGLLIGESLVKIADDNFDDSNVRNDHAYSSFHVSAGEEGREDLEDINLGIKEKDLNIPSSGSQQSSDKNYKCQQCSATFKKAFTLKQHMSTHFTGRCFKCSICNKMFLTNTHLAGHKRRCHPQETQQKFECKLCKKAFKNSNQMKRHQQEVHITKTFNCNHCQLTFSAQIHLEQHDKKHETVKNRSENITTKKKHRCDKCFVRFDNYNFLKAHINREHKI